MSAAAVLAAAAFNLVCTGIASHMSGVMGLPQGVHDFRRVYRIDLAKGRYCLGACTMTSPLAKVTDTQIIFQLEERSQVDDTVEFVSRETGKFTYRIRQNGNADLWNGQCVKAQFEGFPLPRF